jgi:hypothetical protein
MVGSACERRRPPGEDAMTKTFAAVATAAFIAALATILPGITAVSANTPDQPVQQPATKADRVVVPAAACTPRAWPYNDSDCTFQARWQGEKRPVRLVTTDRLNASAR